ncbi:hypothetical protein [Mangrovihabitans endophyticus]|uniref:Uncharacterized protein n=1 Tax=Mangrovihabitans endophyticus TaxID=1751298 RepID=A0A8J3C576_9ACTN|nr:hypothetical protein [Mangrovihabitans endophyticus]GGL11297.1 hypothetical protein GCM10012284_52530 [Mangrovihabitans endophyticus]
MTGSELIKRRRSLRNSRLIFARHRVELARPIEAVQYFALPFVGTIRDGQITRRSRSGERTAREGRSAEGTVYGRVGPHHGTTFGNAEAVAVIDGVRRAESDRLIAGGR